MVDRDPSGPRAWAPAGFVRRIPSPSPATNVDAAAASLVEASALHPRLLERVREAVRARHHSRRTEKAYIAWTRRFIAFHTMRPAEMGAPEVSRFLTHLGTTGHVSASTQNQAFSALLFLSRDTKCCADLSEVT